VTVYATPETRRWRRQGVLTLDPATSAWLDAHVHPGDVMYDIGAGVGACAILAAVERGALAVAFEPGFGAFKALCENVLLNQCARSVIPLPVALADRNALLELVYPHDAGSDVHSLRARAWRSRRESLEAHYTQPVLAERLDDVVSRHELPPPNAIRVHVRKGAEGVLAGADALLREPQLRTMLIAVDTRGEAEGVAAAAARSGFSGVIEGEDADRLTVRLERTTVPRGAVRPVDALRRASRRFLPR
jgi:FkbM family methyltransferase